MSLRRMVLKPEIPTSSMADIAFLLIVFFMLTTVFSTNKGMTHILPADMETVGAANPAIFVEIFPGGGFQVNGVAYTLDLVARFRADLVAKWRINAQKPVILLTDHEAAYGHMIAVLDEMKLAEKAMLVEDPRFALDLTLPNRFERDRYQQLVR